MNFPRRILLVSFVALAASARANETIRISVASDGSEANGDTYGASTSPGGRYVAFNSLASNIEWPGGPTGHTHIYWKDRATNEIRFVSRVPSGNAGNEHSYRPDISWDGRLVAFYSYAKNLVPGTSNAHPDVLLADVTTGVITLVSVSTNGGEANGGAYTPKLSGDGRFVAFSSLATDLVAGDTNQSMDVFVRDMLNGSTERISVATGGSQLNADSSDGSISGDGRFVAFKSDASNAIANDTNGAPDIFIRDRLLGTTTLVSASSAGQQLAGVSLRPSISADGTLVAFSTDAQLFSLDNNATLDAVVKDLTTGTLSVMSLIGGGAATPADPSAVDDISPNGRYVVFSSDSGQIVSSDFNASTDAFRYDRTTGLVARMSLGANGETIGDSVAVNVADDGQTFFFSEGSTLVPNDSGLYVDVFVRNTGPDFASLYCSGKPNSLGCTPFLSFEGTPSTSSTGTFKVRGHDFIPSAAGFFLYSTSGRSNLNFHGGKLCVKAPIVRWLPPKVAQNTGSAPCSGVLSRNFNKRIQSGVDLSLTAGQVVTAQWRQRDGADPAGFGDALSNGIEFTIGP